MASWIVWSTCAPLLTTPSLAFRDGLWSESLPCSQLGTCLCRSGDDQQPFAPWTDALTILPRASPTAPDGAGDGGDIERRGQVHGDDGGDAGDADDGGDASGAEIDVDGGMFCDAITVDDVDDSSEEDLSDDDIGPAKYRVHPCLHWTTCFAWRDFRY